MTGTPQEPETIETIFCTICKGPIPGARAHRQTATCSERCKNRLDSVRAAQRRSRKCPYCLHPSTPEEREAFRVWRQERGDLKVAYEPRDRTGTPKRDLVRALRSANRQLAHYADLLASSDEKQAEEVRVWVREFKALIDNQPEPTTLSA